MDITAKRRRSRVTFLGFDPESSPNFSDYALQSGFPTACTYLESALYYGEKRSESNEDTFDKLLKDFQKSHHIWDRLVKEHGWQKEDFKLFDDTFMTYAPLGNDTFIGFCLANQWEDYELITHANSMWNVANPDQTPKAVSFPEEELATRLLRFDQASALVHKKGIDDLNHYTKGADITGMNESRLYETFGDKAQSIVYIQRYMERDQEISERLRRDLITQYTPTGP